MPVSDWGLRFSAAGLSSTTIALPCLRGIATGIRWYSWPESTTRPDHPTGPLPIVCACLDYGVPYTDDPHCAGATPGRPRHRPALRRGVSCRGDGRYECRGRIGSAAAGGGVLTDAWIHGGGQPDAVALPSTHPSAPLEAGPQMVDPRIDHVFFRPGREDQHVIVGGVRIVGASVDGVYPSDRRAVMADLRWRG